MEEENTQMNCGISEYERFSRLSDLCVVDINLEKPSDRIFKEALNVKNINKKLVIKCG